MSVTNLSFFNLASDRLSWLAARQKVTAENIANANTPGFRARDVTSFERMVEGAPRRTVRLATTDPRHITGTGGAAAANGPAEIVDRSAQPRALDGNSVDLERQAVRATEIADQHRLASELYRKGHDLLSMAIRKR